MASTTAESQEEKPHNPHRKHFDTFHKHSCVGLSVLLDTYNKISPLYSSRGISWSAYKSNEWWQDHDEWKTSHQNKTMYFTFNRKLTLWAEIASYHKSWLSTVIQMLQAERFCYLIRQRSNDVLRKFHTNE
jgi:hypothetical protein